MLNYPVSSKVVGRKGKLHATISKGNPVIWWPMTYHKWNKWINSSNQRCLVLTVTFSQISLKSCRQGTWQENYPQYLSGLSSALYSLFFFFCFFFFLKAFLETAVCGDYIQQNGASLLVGTWNGFQKVFRLKCVDHTKFKNYSLFGTRS